jgi:peptide/nickel transport system ATP-binding protein
MAAPVLELDHLTKYYGPRLRPTVEALKDVSFSVQAGEVLALVGESGSGKSTIAKILNGIEVPTQGSVRIDQKPLAESTRQAVQLVFQDPYSALNPLNSVEYLLSRPLINFAKLRGSALATALRELLEQVKLTPPELFLPKLPHELSGGQRQRVLIARALACRPQIIVADEPVSMLDVSIRAEILALLNELRETASVRAIVYITHDMASARMLADRVVVLYRGKVVETGRLSDIFQQPRHPYTNLLLKVIPRIDAPWPTLAEYPKSGRTRPAGPSCPFLDRCPLAFSRCESEDPALMPVAVNGHQVACHAASQGASSPVDVRLSAPPSSPSA